MGIVVDEKTGARAGQPVRITNWSGYNMAESVSRDGKQLAVIKAHALANLYVGDLEQNGARMGSPRRLTMSDSRDFLSAWARDGKSVLFDSNRTGRSQIFRQKFEQSAAEPLVMTADDASGASLSPDGAWILYWSSPHSSDQSPQPFRLMRVPAPGGSSEQVLQFPPDAQPAFDCPIQPSGSCVLGDWAQGQLVF
jgi:Tol biopolymer transport system component